MSKCVIILLFVISIFVSKSDSQPLVEWTESSTYTGSAFLHQLDDGGYVATGSWSIVSSEAQQFAISEFNPDGSLRWTSTVGDPESVRYENGCATSDGGYVLVGYVNIADDTTIAQACKVDADGDSVWTKRYKVGVNYNSLWGVCEIPGGDLLMCGSMFAASDDRQGLLIRTNSDGDSLWTRNYGGVNTQFFRSQICPTYDGYYLMAGETILPDRTNFWLVKVNDSGALQFERHYGGEDIERANTVVQRITGDYVIGGSTYSFGVNGGCDAWYVLAANNGDSLSSRTFDDGGDESCASMFATPDGGIVQASSRWVSGPPGFDAWIIKTDWHGSIQWTKTMGGDASDALSRIIQTSDGGFLLSGVSGSPGYTGPGAWLVKLGDEGPHSLVIKLHYGTPHLKLIWQTSLPGAYHIYATYDPNLNTNPPGAGWDLLVTIPVGIAGLISWDHDNAITLPGVEQRRYVVTMTQ